jgi:hypothetical protein
MTCMSSSWQPNWQQQEIKKGQKKTNMQIGHLDGDTQQTCPPLVNLLYTVANKEVE